MDIQYLIQMLNNKLVVLNNAETQASLVGDLDTVNSIDQDILTVQDTLAKLNLLVQISSVAAATNTTATQVVTSGLLSSQNTAPVPDSPTAVLLSYDLSTYAADPLYLQKLTDILQVMPVLDSAQDIDSYISSEAIGSPLSGQMIIAAAQQYAVDTRLLSSIFELESNFGTAGVAVSTLNPGNVGNTGTTTRTYNSWQDGVAAVAQWLSLHPATALTNAIVNAAASAAAVASSTPVVTPQPVTAPLDPSAFTEQATSTPVIDQTQPQPPVQPQAPAPAPTSAPTPTPTTPTQPAPAATSTPPVTPPAPITPIATSTAPVDPSIASSTSATSTDPTLGNINTASSTPVIDTDDSDATTTTATSTAATTATSTPPDDTPDSSSDASSTPSSSATSTPDTGA